VGAKYDQVCVPFCRCIEDANASFFLEDSSVDAKPRGAQSLRRPVRGFLSMCELELWRRALLGTSSLDN
jgi:hypothetical protein